MASNAPGASAPTRVPVRTGTPVPPVLLSPLALRAEALRLTPLAEVLALMPEMLGQIGRHLDHADPLKQATGRNELRALRAYFVELFDGIEEVDHAAR